MRTSFIREGRYKMNGVIGYHDGFIEEGGMMTSYTN